MTGTGTEPSAADVFADVTTGDLRGAAAALERLVQDRSAVGAAWRAALLAVLHLVDTEAEAPPTVHDLEAFVGGSTETRRAACHACSALERAAFVAFDVAALDSLRQVHAKLAGRLGDAQRQVHRADAWLRVLRGDVAELEDEGKQLYAAAAGAQDASAVIDATLVRALAALTEDRLKDATGLARRASRMARTEGLRPERYLAAVVLARVRRRGGRPHLATRILAGIAPIAAPSWQGWLSWERILAGGSPDADDLGHGFRPADRAVLALTKLLETAGRGDLVDFDARADALLEEVAGFREISREATALRAALDYRPTAPECPDAVRQWALGDEAETPAGFHGLVGPPDGPADSTIACVVSRPEHEPRRILRIAVPLLEVEGDVLRLSRTRLRRGRVDTAVAALALGGPSGLADEDLFRRAYEFAFTPSLHAGILDVLVHRMRARLEGAATIHRKEGRITIEPHGILVLSDPRCVEHVEDRLLRLIARLGGVTTRQAAQELDVSVRTAQLALRRLLEAGDCVLNRNGRRVQYLVEDTTFTEPTRF